jgi:hypothetical protein
LTNLRTLEWRKLVLLPGILDAATKLEMRSTLDLRTWRPTVEAKLGLRRKFASSGLSLIHRVELARGCSLDVGATLTLPEELRLATTAGAGLRELAQAARVGVELDTLEVSVDLDEALEAVAKRATPSDNTAK